MRFAYLRDPLFLVCVALYFVNRWLIKPNFDGLFWHGYLNDLICIPFWVPIMLFGLRAVGLRRHDRQPEAHEILIPLLLWAILFELWLPATAAYRDMALGDPLDILCYTSGALVATLFWQWRYRETGNKLLTNLPAADS